MISLPGTQSQPINPSGRSVSSCVAETPPSERASPPTPSSPHDLPTSPPAPPLERSPSPHSHPQQGLLSQPATASKAIAAAAAHAAPVSRDEPAAAAEGTLRRAAADEVLAVEILSDSEELLQSPTSDDEPIGSHQGAEIDVRQTLESPPTVNPSAMNHSNRVVRSRFVEPLGVRATRQRKGIGLLLDAVLVPEVEGGPSPAHGGSPSEAERLAAGVLAEDIRADSGAVQNRV